MLPILLILSILTGILIIVLVLLQPGKGDLSATFGGISGQFGSMFGMQRTADFLSKLTKYLAIAMLLLILLTNKFFLGGPKIEQVKPVTEGASVPTSPMIPSSGDMEKK